MRILVGVTGGIAAYKALEFVRLAVKAGNSVRVVQTPASLRFVGRSSFAAITGAPVLASEFEEDPLMGAWPGEDPGRHVPISHLALVERADAMVIAPASANVIARLAAGSCDDLVATAAIAAKCPVIVAPAMNGAMWENAATVANVATLRDRGVLVIDPTSGDLASKGEHGTGRLVEPDDLLAATLEAGRPDGDSPLRGLRVLVSAGGTREPIDGVRYIGNRSSGRMGVELAAAAARAGSRVTLVGANLQVASPAGCECVEVVTADEMDSTLRDLFPDCDVLVMAAAVADFRPASPVAGKIDKSQGLESVELEPVPDILAGLAADARSDQTVVGFAAEHGLNIDRARSKMEAKGIDAIVVNDVSDSSIGFDSPQNEVTFVTAAGESRVERAGKAEIAASLVELIGRMIASR